MYFINRVAIMSVFRLNVNIKKNYCYVFTVIFLFKRQVGVHYINAFCLSIICLQVNIYYTVLFFAFMFENVKRRYTTFVQFF